MNNDYSHCILHERIKANGVTIVYWLIAAATITFSKRKGTATKRGWLLYKSSH